MYNGIERRKYPRVGATLLVSYKDKMDNNFNLSQTKNVSQGGILLTTSEVFTSGTFLDMIISFPFAPQRVRATGKVVRQKEIAKDSIYETGIEFTGLDRTVFDKLGEFSYGRQ